MLVCHYNSEAELFYSVFFCHMLFRCCAVLRRAILCFAISSWCGYEGVLLWRVLFWPNCTVACRFVVYCFVRVHNLTSWLLGLPFQSAGTTQKRLWSHGSPSVTQPWLSARRCLVIVAPCNRPGNRRYLVHVNNTFLLVSCCDKWAAPFHVNRMRRQSFTVFRRCVPSFHLSISYSYFLSHAIFRLSRLCNPHSEPHSWNVMSSPTALPFPYFHCLANGFFLSHIILLFPIHNLLQLLVNIVKLLLI